jgi:hypothetical protein
MTLPALRIAAVLAVALVCGEVMVRLAMRPSLDYASIFAPGPYCDRGSVGALGACPGREGVQRIYNAPIYGTYKVGPSGFRGPFRNVPEGQAAERIVLLGGQSQGWGFGLENEETFAAEMARAVTCAPVEVHSAALLGATDAHVFMTYRAEGGDAAPLAHLFYTAYWEAPPDWKPVLQKFDVARLRPDLAYFGGWYVRLTWPAPGPLRHSELYVRGTKRLSDLSAIVSRLIWDAKPNRPLMRYPAADFVAELQAWAAKRSARFSYVPLPNGTAARTQQHVAGFAAFPTLNLDREAQERGLSLELFPDAHYNPKLAAFIGGRLAQEFCRTRAGL